MPVANKFSEDSRRRLMCGKRVNSVSSLLMKSSVLHDIFLSRTFEEQVIGKLDTY